MLNFDMHYHTTSSDGTSSFSERLYQARDKGLVLATPTDHDFITKQEDLDQSNGDLISTNFATEISAQNYLKPKSLHLTCYSNKFSSKIYDVLKNTREKKVGMIYAQIMKLKEKGFVLDAEKLYKYFKENGKKKINLNKYDIAGYILKNKENQKMIFDIMGEELDQVGFLCDFLKEEGRLNGEYCIKVDDYEPSVEVCGQLAKSNNAILSIAHPNFTFTKEGMDTFNKELGDYVDMGINALEINSLADREWVKSIYKQAKKYNLIITAGSDNHEFGVRDHKHGHFGELNKLLSYNDRLQILENYFDFLDK